MTRFRIALALAFFFAVASTAAAATLTGSPSTVAPGGTVTVSWSDVTNPNRVDWIGMYVQGAPEGTYFDNWVFTNSCSQVAGLNAAASGSCSFTMPTTLGTYEFRLFAGQSYNVVASGLVQVATPPPVAATLTASPSTVAPGGSVSLNWSGVTSPNRLDWIAIYIQGAPDGSYDNWLYTSSCSQTPGLSGAASGSCTVAMPTTPGTYEFRLFRSESYILLAKSGLVQVSTPPAPTALTANPSSVGPGGSVTVSWSGVANPNTLDWIGRFIPGAPDSQRDTFVYTSSCTQTAGTNAAASGSCPFTMPLAQGSYEFRLFASTGTKLATSGLVQVSIGPGPTPPPSGGTARIVSYTTSTTLTADDVSRSIINNSGATAPIILNLPPSAVGNVVSIYVIAGQTITINPNGTERIQILTNANGDAIQSDTVRGTTITLVCQAAGSWEPMGQIGAWFDVN